MTDPREQWLETSLVRLHAGIADAARQAGRDPDDIVLVAVTKTFPVADVLRLAALGVRDIGESRDGEARQKAAAAPELRVHFVGRLQRNKAASVARYAHCVHSVDSLGLVTALDRAADRRGRELAVAVQLSFDSDPDRGGAPTADLPALADAVAAAPALRLAGVMGVPPVGTDPAACYHQLAGMAARIRAVHPAATMISAGMSADYPIAIRNGATHVRIGSALLGARPSPVR